MIQFDRTDAYDLLPQPGIKDATSGYSENYRSAVEKIKLTDQSQSKDMQLKELWDPIIEELNESFPNQGFNGGMFGDPGDFLGIGLGVSSTAGHPKEMYKYHADTALKFMEENQESLPEHLRGITLESLEEIVRERARIATDQYEDVASRSATFKGSLGQFTGGVVGVIDDPVNAFAMIGGSAKNLWRLAVSEAVIGASVGAMAEGGVMEWYEELGYDYTYQDFIRNVTLDATAGVVLGVGAKAGTDVVKKGWEAYKGSGRANKDSEIIADMAQDAEDFEADNPFENPDLPPSKSEHVSRAVEAEAAVVKNTAPTMVDEPTIAPSPETVAAATDNLDNTVFSVPARDVIVDAKRFQFKEGGDEYGVTERLQGVTEWDPVKAGTVIFWEGADGRTFVADGHQRVGLANRIMAQNPDQNISVIGYKLREVDGITSDKARVIAAMANIAQGTGTAIDAAKVLRVDPSRISELPPRSVLVRQANDLVNLSDQAFGAIVNNVIPSNYGAIVGRLIDDPKMQDAAISVLAKSDPANAFQAEAIVRQVREMDAVQETQVSLFGEEVITESLFNERAKVLDRTYKMLRADKASFENLSKNAERIEAEGNQLAKDQNQRRADQDGQAITLLQALANRKGVLSDELSAAARTARETNNFSAAARSFTDSVRRGIERGDFDRASTGDVGRAVQSAPQSRASAIEEEPTLDGFDIPTGPAAEAQVDQMVRDTFRDLDEPVVAEEAVALAIKTPDQYAKYLEDGNYTDEFQQLMLGPVGDQFNVIRAVFNEDPDFALDEFRSVAGESASQKELGSFKEQVTRLTQDLVKDFPDQMTVYRAGDIKKGEVQSYTIDPRYDVEGNLPWRRGKDQPLEAYTVNKSDIVGSPDITRRGPIGEGEVLIDSGMVRGALRDLEEVAEAKPVERSLKDRQPIETVEDIYAIAQESQDFIDGIGRAISDDMGIVFKNPGLKKIETAQGKMQRKSYASAREMTDISRGGFVINKAADADAIVRKFSEVSEVLDEGWGFTPAGYFDRKILVRTPNGIVSEIQIWSPKLLEAKTKKGGHKLYEKSRSLDPKADVKQIEELTQQQRELYSKALSEEDASFRALSLEGISKGPKVLSNVDLKELSSAITRPEVQTSKPSTGVQEPPGVSRATALVGEKDTAGRPSQLVKKTSDIDEDPFTETVSDIAETVKDVDYDLEIPLAARFDEETGDIIADVVTVRDLKAEVDAEDALITRLGVCGL